MMMGWYRMMLSKLAEMCQKLLSLFIMQSDEQDDFSFFESFYEKSSSNIDENVRKTEYYEEYIVNDDDYNSDILEEEEESQEIDPLEFNGLEQCIEDLLNFPHYYDSDPNSRGYDPNEIMHFKEMSNYLCDFLKSNQSPDQYKIFVDSNAIKSIVDLTCATSEPEIEEECINMLSFFLYTQDYDSVDFSSNGDFFYRLLSLADKEIDFSNRREYQKTLVRAQYIICMIISMEDARKNIPDDFYPQAFPFFTNGAMFMWFIRVYVQTIEINKDLLPDIIEMISTKYLKASQSKYTNESKFLDIQKDAILALRSIIPQFPISDESTEILNQYITPPFLKLIIEAKFNETLVADVFGCLLLLLRREVHIDFILDESLADIEFKLKGIPCKERLICLYYIFRLIHIDLYTPENSIYFQVYNLMQNGTSQEKEYSCAFIAEAVNKELIPPFQRRRIIENIDEESQEEEPLFIDNMPFEMVEVMIEVMVQLIHDSELLSIVCRGLNVIFFSRREFVGNLLENDFLFDEFNEFINTKLKSAQSDVAESILSISSIISEFQKEHETDE